MPENGKEVLEEMEVTEEVVDPGMQDEAFEALSGDTVLEDIKEPLKSEEEILKDVEDAPAEEPSEAVVPEAEVPAEESPARGRRSNSSRLRHTNAPGRQVLADEELGEGSEGITHASRNQARRLYNSGEAVHTIDAENPHKRLDDHARDTYLLLAQSMKTGVPVDGVLSMIQATSEGGTYVGVVIMDGGYRVYIPLTHMFVLNAGTVRDGNLNDARRLYAERRLGATISFIVRGIDERSKVAYASRLAAMEYYADRNYREPQTRTGKPRFQPGDIVEATITYVSKSGIGVDVFGVETFIHMSELSYTRVADVERDLEYNVGDRINVKILSYEDMTYNTSSGSNGTSFRLINLQASVKQISEDPNELYYNFFNVGTRTQAVITGVTDSGYYVRLANLRDAFCPFLRGRDLRPMPLGSLVIVKVIRKVDDSREIFGEIKSLVSLPKY